MFSFLLFSNMYGSSRVKRELSTVSPSSWRAWMKMKQLKRTETRDLDRRPKLRVTLWLALAEVALLTCTRTQETASAKRLQWAGDTAVVARGLDLLPALTLAVLDEGQLHQLVLHEGGLHQLRSEQKANCSGQNVCDEAIKFSVSWRIPPSWACLWARGRTPEPRQHSSRRIASETRRRGRTDCASLRAAPATPPPGCPEARIHCGSTPPATASLVGTRVCAFAYWLHQPHFRQASVGGETEAYLLGLPGISESLLAASERA